MMRLEYDKESDSAYCYIKDKIKDGEVKKTESKDNNTNFDYDEEGKLIGIEILNASKVLPQILLK